MGDPVAHQQPEVDAKKVEAARARGVVVDSRRKIRRAPRQAIRSTSSQVRGEVLHNAKRESASHVAAEPADVAPTLPVPQNAHADQVLLQAVLERIADDTQRMADAQERQAVAQEQLAASQLRSEALLRRILAGSNATVSPPDDL